jgi:intracellular multiplication protein IcmL
VLTGMLVYVIKDPPGPVYFATDEAGKFILDVPVQQPNMTTDAVAAWVTAAIEAAYSYDYVNYRAELQEAQKYFTDYGWRTYLKGLESSNNLVALNDRHQVVTAHVIAPPILLIEGPLGKAAIYAWKFQVPVLVTYLMPPSYDDKTKFSNPLLITVIVERQDVLSSYKGLGIVQMVAELVQNNTPQPLSATPT